jgi:hypothetical protein
MLRLLALLLVLLPLTAADTHRITLRSSDPPGEIVLVGFYDAERGVLTRIDGDVVHETAIDRAQVVSVETVGTPPSPVASTAATVPAWEYARLETSLITKPEAGGTRFNRIYELRFWFPGASSFSGYGSLETCGKKGYTDPWTEAVEAFLTGYWVQHRGRPMPERDARYGETELLQLLGEEGWELVSFALTPASPWWRNANTAATDTERNQVFLFKRPKVTPAASAPAP